MSNETSNEAATPAPIRKLPAFKQREIIYGEMTPSLQKVAAEFREKHKLDAKGFLMIRYDMGVRIKEILEKPDEYGVEGVKQLAAFFHKPQDELYDLRAITDKYTRDEVKKLAEREMPDGSHISLGHILAIITVKKAADRTKLWNRVFSESLSARSLVAEISGGIEKTNVRAPGAGRKPSRPSAPAAAVQQVYETAHTFNNRVPGWSEALFDSFDEVPPDKVDKVIFDKMNKAIEEWETMATNIEDNIDKLRANRDRARDIIDAREVAQARQKAGVVAKKRPAKEPVAV